MKRTGWGFEDGVQWHSVQWLKMVDITIVFMGVIHVYKPTYIWRFPKIGVSQIIHLSGIFHYKPSILGYHQLWKPHILGGAHPVAFLISSQVRRVASTESSRPTGRVFFLTIQGPGAVHGENPTRKFGWVMETKTFWSCRVSCHMAIWFMIVMLDICS